jgi:hypothetical protein
MSSTSLEDLLDMLEKNKPQSTPVVREPRGETDTTQRLDGITKQINNAIALIRELNEKVHVLATRTAQHAAALPTLDSAVDVEAPALDFAQDAGDAVETLVFDLVSTPGDAVETPADLAETPGAALLASAVAAAVDVLLDETRPPPAVIKLVRRRLPERESLSISAPDAMPDFVLDVGAPDAESELETTHEIDPAPAALAEDLACPSPPALSSEHPPAPDIQHAAADTPAPDIQPAAADTRIDIDGGHNAPVRIVAPVELDLF